MTTWSDALDLFERRLEAYRDVLEHDVEPVIGDWPPPGLDGQPLPADLVPRARHLLGRAGELESLIKIRQDSLRLRGAVAPRHHRPFVGRPSHFTDL